jgi:DNA-binding transcriptional LysR family regulator
MLDLARLRIFREVAARRSFSAAAEALDYTQSAVSQQVSKLERDVGLVLIERSRRPIGLTEAGEVLFARTEVIFGEVATVETELNALAGLEAGTLRLGGFATACATVLPLAIRRFAARHPHVLVTLSEMEPEPAGRRLRAAEVDLAVTYRFDEDADATAGDDGLESVALVRDPFVIALPERHRLARRRSLRLDELRDERWLGAPATGASAGYRGFITRLCREAGFEPAIAFEPGDLWTGRGIIAAGLAVGLMPRLAFTIPYPGVAIRPLAGISPARTILAVHMPSRGVPGAIPMLDCLAEAFASDPLTPARTPA